MVNPQCTLPTQPPPTTMLNTDFDGDYLLRSSSQTKDYAKENGWDCIVAGDSELFVDLDTKESIEAFPALYELFLQLFPDSVIMRQTPSKSGVGQHVYVRLKYAMAATERIAAQAALGSDGKREMLSLIRAMTGDPEPVLFFELKPKGYTVRPRTEISDDTPF